MIPLCAHINIFSDEDRRTLDRIGAQYGCHTCGTKDPATISGHFIADLQPPATFNWMGEEQRMYPHCLFCKKAQGAFIRDMIIDQGLSLQKGIETPGCIAFIGDGSSGGGSIKVEEGRNVWATGDCVAFSMMSYMDGMTEVLFGSARDFTPSKNPDIDAVIDTPSRSVGIFTFERRLVGHLFACGEKARVRVWSDHPSEPSHVDVVVD